jgi:ketosteroid isomerase-like protein
MPIFVTPSRIATTLLLTAAMAMPLPAFTQKHPRHETRDEIHDMERQWRQAELTDDATAMDKLLSDDYLGITGNGQVVTKMQQLDHMRSRSLSLTRLDISDVKIKKLGSVAVVTSAAEIEGTVDGQPLHGNFRSTRVYQRLPGGAWKLTNFEATRVRPAHTHDRADAEPANDPAAN